MGFILSKFMSFWGQEGQSAAKLEKRERSRVMKKADWMISEMKKPLGPLGVGGERRRKQLRRASNAGLLDVQSNLGSILPHTGKWFLAIIHLNVQFHSHACIDSLPLVMFLSSRESAEHKLVIVGLDNAGKSTILYQLYVVEAEQSVERLCENRERMRWQ